MPDRIPTPRHAPRRRTALACALLTLGLAAGPSGAETRTVDSEQQTFTVEVLADGLAHPWALAFLPDGAALITEREGRLRLWADGTLDPRPIDGVPPVRAVGQGGLLDVLVPPDFAETGHIYLSLSHPADGDGANTRVVRAVFDREAHALRDVTVIVDATPVGHTSRHYGSRLAIGGDGKLYVTTGERGERPRAQDLTDLAGKVLRLNPDGSIPEDNPFVGHADVRPEIYALGTRNAQGMDVHPDTGVVWFHEHGPRGGDELNIARGGANYGWPIITYGLNYNGTPMGEGTAKPGLQQPVYYWDPSIAPSGMTIYDGAAFPEWRGDIFVGALKFRLLARLEMDGDRVVAEERLLTDELGRIRAVVTGPDGALYLLTDAGNGRLVRLGPTS
ncbi:PQQ-dependent sugar dehydrogenase [Roseospira marina]|uniref:PQQ-dependent sugar dehydrogenase n=1 Tax=Roseospira marina TaxID=140057 RepID=A0A5M6ID29_9PROT|nr:PQQ-dependent sugar dehydrogenase [Roseospira marina]KAA5606190.1 PQQ-dependent sugar dehydrogenase [Roseospira marina]MBB4314335.1 glucose/arabinose dehydrogenase [Roseospira marina]MBB5087495.1 glucose/arabinose dehydrogenase [Roseospira marina]